MDDCAYRSSEGTSILLYIFVVFPRVVSQVGNTGFVVFAAPGLCLLLQIRFHSATDAQVSCMKVPCTRPGRHVDATRWMQFLDFSTALRLVSANDFCKEQS